MNGLEATLRRIATDLSAAGHRWAIVGGLAVSARAEPRTTRDVDLVVAVADDREAEQLIVLLQSGGYRVLSTVEQERVERLATVRLVPPGSDPGGALVDLLFASSGIEPEVVDRADPLTILPGVTVHVASVGHLLALKVLARDDRRRPQDWDDIRALLRESQEVDFNEARSALRLIESRGFHRGRTLVRLLDEAVAELSSS